jgi:hypothetical protein
MSLGNTPSEKQWVSTILEPIAVTGFVINVISTTNLHTKQKVTLILGSNSKELEIRAVLSPTQLMVGEIGKSFTQLFNPAAYDGGRLQATDTHRNEITADIHSRAVYEEEPAMALRTVGVNSLGFLSSTPMGQITDLEPETRIVSGPCMNPTKIRERVPSIRKFTGTITVSGSDMTFASPVPYWMVPTAHLAVIDGGGTNLGTELVIASVDVTRTIVSFTTAPIVFAGSITLDASIGEIVKATNLVYDPASFALTKIYYAYDTVNLADLL